MDSKLTIAYAGTLMGYDPGEEKRTFFRTLKDFFWEYHPRTCYHYTRSGFFLFQGLKEFKRKYPEFENKLQVELWGSIRTPNLKQVKQFGIEKIVRISGRISKAETEQKLNRADVLFLPLESSIDKQPPLFIPGKLFEYLAFGKPILGLMEDSEVSEILTRSGLGIIVSPFDQEKIADTLKHLIEQKKYLTQIYQPDKEYIEQFSFDRTVEELTDLFSKFIKPGIR